MAIAAELGPVPLRRELQARVLHRSGRAYLDHPAHALHHVVCLVWTDPMLPAVADCSCGVAADVTAIQSEPAPRHEPLTYAVVPADWEDDEACSEPLTALYRRPRPV